jgi:SnoaL-like domain
MYGEGGSQVSNTADLTAIADGFAIIDLVNRYVDDIDGKRFDRMGEFFTEDAVVRWSPEKSMQGRSAIIDSTRQRLDTDEIVTYHFVANFSPVIQGDAAEADVRVRAMHNGVGARSGRFYESFGFQGSRFVRTPDGWRCNYYEWRVTVKLGSMDVFD